jgi:hypothetical protein
MRRTVSTGVILACLFWMLGSSPAWAHPGATAFTIQVGAPTSVSILVPADYGKPIDRIAVTVPAGFELQAAEPPAGWHASQSGPTVVFSGGVIPANQFAVVALRGVAPHKATLVFPITTGSPDGSETRYTGGLGTPNQAAIIYAGFTPKQPHGGGVPWTPVAAAALLAVGIGGTAALTVRRRRRVAEGSNPSP